MLFPIETLEEIGLYMDEATWMGLLNTSKAVANQINSTFRNEKKTQYVLKE
jgi:hypothetical protein